MSTTARDPKTMTLPSSLGMDMVARLSTALPKPRPGCLEGLRHCRSSAVDDQEHSQRSTDVVLCLVYRGHCAGLPDYSRQPSTGAHTAAPPSITMKSRRHMRPCWPK